MNRANLSGSTSATFRVAYSMIERITDMNDARERLERQTERLKPDTPLNDVDFAFATVADLRTVLDALSNDDAKPDGSPFIWKWIERAIFDETLSARECLYTLAHYPNAPWNLGRWDVDHKPYAEQFYKAFPKAALAKLEQQETTGGN